ncbi:hypothetical protein BDY17DRAFT_6912 [Neohortaea acidophila]|uniref:Involucrin repeat protein n=1 Tax=Neohortaea acidophila TaxID=245834 RepID=A0A6A6Q5A2_9PEZI|nr:uncharacterized protein BDY17DRAFT_6912 [Neohortaea acidophila]KAF2487241.1 hypothetical protein BDY17DRAFT_6912 [Neohortaea acidophila]
MWKAAFTGRSEPASSSQRKKSRGGEESTVTTASSGNVDDNKRRSERSRRSTYDDAPSSSPAVPSSRKDVSASAVKLYDDDDGEGDWEDNSSKNDDRKRRSKGGKDRSNGKKAGRKDSETSGSKSRGLDQARDRAMPDMGSFAQFPGQYAGGVMGSAGQRTEFMKSGAVPSADNQFGLTRADSYGAAADYYEDEGQSVARQPGVRSKSPNMLVNPYQHLITPTVEEHPAQDTGHGSAADFYEGRVSPVPFEPSTQSSSKKSSSYGTIAGIGAAIGAAGLGLAAGKHDKTSAQSPSQDQNSTSYQQRAPSSSMSSSRPSRKADRQYSEPVLSSSNGVSRGLPPSQQPGPATPGKRSSPTNTGLYTAGAAAAAGAAGLEAYEMHERGEQRNGYATPRGSQPYHEHKGPMTRLKDGFFNLVSNDEDVIKMEMYTEYIGVCKYCFDPRTSPYDAPRVHHYHPLNQRDSFESLRKRRSIERMRRSSRENLGRTNSNRIDKDSRYFSSEGSKRRSSRDRAELLAGGAAAAVGTAMAANALSYGGKDFDDTYSIKSGHRESSAVGRRNRSSSNEDRRKMARGVIGKDSKEEYVMARTSDGRTEKRKVRRSRSTSKDRTGAIAAGAVLTGAALAAEASRHRHEEGSNRARRSRSSSRSNSPGGFFGLFSPSRSKKRRESPTTQRKKRRGLFNFGNNSFSSSDSDLAFGAVRSGLSARRQSSVRSPRRKNSDEHIAATVGAIGATAAALAAAQGGRRVDPRLARPELGAKKEARTMHDRVDARGSSDDEWEDELPSDVDDASSIGSALAFGDYEATHPNLGGWAGRNEPPAPAYQSRPDSGRLERTESVDTPTSSVLKRPLQEVDPRPLSEPVSLAGSRQASIARPYEASAAAARDQIQQPRPIAPIQPAFTQSPPPMDDSDRRRPSQPRRTQSSPTNAHHFLEDAAVLGAAAIGTAGIIAAVQGRKAKEPSNVRWGLTEEQERKHARDLQQENGSRPRDDRERAAKDEAARYTREQDVIRTRQAENRRAAEAELQRQQAEQREAEAQAEVYRQREREHQEREDAYCRDHPRSGDVSRQVGPERRRSSQSQQDRPQQQNRDQRPRHQDGYDRSGWETSTQSGTPWGAIGAGAAAATAGAIALDRYEQRKEDAPHEKILASPEHRAFVQKLHEMGGAADSDHFAKTTHFSSTLPDTRPADRQAGSADRTAGVEYDDSRDAYVAEIRPSARSTSQPPDNTDIYDPESYRRGARSPGDRARYVELARQAASKVTDVDEMFEDNEAQYSQREQVSQAEFFAPEELQNREAGHKEKVVDPTDNDEDQVHRSAEEEAQAVFEREWAVKQSGPIKFAPFGVPRLGLVSPTPPPGATRKRRATSPFPVARPDVADLQDDSEESKPSGRRRSVTWGADRTHVYDVPSPEAEHDKGSYVDPHRETTSHAAVDTAAVAIAGVAAGVAAHEIDERREVSDEGRNSDRAGAVEAFEPQLERTSSYQPPSMESVPDSDLQSPPVEEGNIQDTQPAKDSPKRETEASAFADESQPRAPAKSDSDQKASDGVPAESEAEFNREALQDGEDDPTAEDNDVAEDSRPAPRSDTPKRKLSKKEKRKMEKAAKRSGAQPDDTIVDDRDDAPTEPTNTSVDEQDDSQRSTKSRSRGFADVAGALMTAAGGVAAVAADVDESRNESSKSKKGKGKKDRKSREMDRDIRDVEPLEESAAVTPIPTPTGMPGGWTSDEPQAVEAESPQEVVDPFQYQVHDDPSPSPQALKSEATRDTAMVNVSSNADGSTQSTEERPEPIRHGEETSPVREADESDRMSDARSIKSEPNRTSKSRRSSQGKQSTYDGEPEAYEDADSVAASEPVDLYESTKNSKRRSRSGEDDEASASSSRSRREKAEKRSSKDKKSGIFGGIFSRKSNESSSSRKTEASTRRKSTRDSNNNDSEDEERLRRRRLQTEDESPDVAAREEEGLDDPRRSASFDDEQDQSFLDGRVGEMPPLPVSGAVSADWEGQDLGMPATAVHDAAATTREHADAFDLITHDQHHDPTTPHQQDDTARELTQYRFPDIQAPQLQSPSVLTESEKSQRRMSVNRPVSNTAVPLRLPGHHPLTPSPRVDRIASFGNPLTSSPSTPTSGQRTRQSRPPSTEIRPLYLLERNRKPQDVEDSLPSLPSSKPSSRASSRVGSDEYESAAEEFGSPARKLGLMIDINQANAYHPDPDYLDSQQTTPRASEAPKPVFVKPPRQEPEFYTWEDFAQDERMRSADAEEDSQKSDHVPGQSSRTEEPSAETLDSDALEKGLVGAAVLGGTAIAAGHVFSPEDGRPASAAPSALPSLSRSSSREVHEFVDNEKSMEEGAAAGSSTRAEVDSHAQRPESNDLDRFLDDEDRMEGGEAVIGAAPSSSRAVGEHGRFDPTDLVEEAYAKADEDRISPRAGTEQEVPVASAVAGEAEPNHDNEQPHNTHSEPEIEEVSKLTRKQSKKSKKQPKKAAGRGFSTSGPSTWTDEAMESKEEPAEEDAPTNMPGESERQVPADTGVDVEESAAVTAGGLAALVAEESIQEEDRRKEDDTKLSDESGQVEPEWQPSVSRKESKKDKKKRRQRMVDDIYSENTGVDNEPQATEERVVQDTAATTQESSEDALSHEPHDKADAQPDEGQARALDEFTEPPKPDSDRHEQAPTARPSVSEPQELNLDQERQARDISNDTAVPAEALLPHGVAQEAEWDEKPATEAVDEPAEEFTWTPSQKKGKKGKKGKRQSTFTEDASDLPVVETQAASTADDKKDASVAPAYVEAEAGAEAGAEFEAEAMDNNKVDPQAEGPAEEFTWTSTPQKKGKKGKKSKRQSTFAEEASDLPEIETQPATIVDDPKDDIVAPAAAEADAGTEAEGRAMDSQPEQQAEEPVDLWSFPSSKKKKGKKGKKAAFMSFADFEDSNATASDSAPDLAATSQTVKRDDAEAINSTAAKESIPEDSATSHELKNANANATHKTTSAEDRSVADAALELEVPARTGHGAMDHEAEEAAPPVRPDKDVEPESETREIQGDMDPDEPKDMTGDEKLTDRADEVAPAPEAIVEDEDTTAFWVGKPKKKRGKKGNKYEAWVDPEPEPTSSLFEAEERIPEEVPQPLVTDATTDVQGRASDEELWALPKKGKKGKRSSKAATIPAAKETSQEVEVAPAEDTGDREILPTVEAPATPDHPTEQSSQTIEAADVWDEVPSRSWSKKKKKKEAKKSRASSLFESMTALDEVGQDDDAVQVPSVDKPVAEQDMLQGEKLPADEIAPLSEERSPEETVQSPALDDNTSIPLEASSQHALLDDRTTSEDQQPCDQPKESLEPQAQVDSARDLDNTEPPSIPNEPEEDEWAGFATKRSKKEKRKSKKKGGAIFDAEPSQVETTSDAEVKRFTETEQETAPPVTDTEASVNPSEREAGDAEPSVTTHPKRSDEISHFADDDEIAETGHASTEQTAAEAPSTTSSSKDIRDMGFAATIAAGLAASNFDPETVMREASRRASPTGVAEADPDDVWEAPTRKKKGKKAKREPAVVDTWADEPKEASSTQRGASPAADDLNETLKKTLEESGFDSAILQQAAPSVDTETRELPENNEFSFTTSKRKKSKKAKRGETFAADESPATPIDREPAGFEEMASKDKSSTADQAQYPEEPDPAVDLVMAGDRDLDVDEMDKAYRVARSKKRSKKKERAIAAETLDTSEAERSSEHKDMSVSDKFKDQDTSMTRLRKDNDDHVEEDQVEHEHRGSHAGVDAKSLVEDAGIVAAAGALAAGVGSELSHSNTRSHRRSDRSLRETSSRHLGLLPGDRPHAEGPAPWSESHLLEGFRDSGYQEADSPVIQRHSINSVTSDKFGLHNSRSRDRLREHEPGERTRAMFEDGDHTMHARSASRETEDTTLESTTKTRGSHLFQSTPETLSSRRYTDSSSPTPREETQAGQSERDSFEADRHSPSTSRPHNIPLYLDTISEEHHGAKRSLAGAELRDLETSKASKRSETPHSIRSREQQMVSPSNEDRERRRTTRQTSVDLRSPSAMSNRSSVSAGQFRGAEELRSYSRASNRSSTPGLRRASLSGDLRAASRRGDAGSAVGVRGSPKTIPFEPPPTPPSNDDEHGPGASRAIDMSDVYVSVHPSNGGSIDSLTPSAAGIWRCGCIAELANATA